MKLLNEASPLIFEIYNTDIVIESCTFYEISKNIFKLAASKLRIYSVTLSMINCSISQGCLIQLVEDSYAYIEKLTATQVYNIYEAAGIYLENSSLTASNILIDQISSYALIGTCIYSENSVLAVNHSIFYDFKGSCFFTVYSRLNIQDTCFLQKTKEDTVSEQTKIYDSSIVSESSSIILIKNCMFFFNMALNGGAIKIFKVTNNAFIDENENISILNCSFALNLAIKEGGSLYLHETKVRISNCIFHNNQADFGGAIFFSTSG